VSAGRKTAAEKLGNLVRRLATNYDGEIVGTVKAIRRVLKSSNHVLRAR
jgi:hypothetical protein